jgi:hypothetical protein
MDEVWPMDDAFTDGVSRNIVNPTHTLGWFGAHVASTNQQSLGPSIMDGCNGELLGSRVNNGYRYESHVGTPNPYAFPIGLNGSFAAFIGNPFGNPTGLIFRATPKTASASWYVQLQCDASGTGLSVGFVNAQPSHAIPGSLPTGQTNHVMARWTLSAGGSLHFETYVNFVLVDTWDTTVAVAWEVNNGNIILGAGTLSAAHFQNTVGYSSSYISGSDIAGLKAAFDQNQSAYIDPNTNCRSG